MDYIKAFLVGGSICFIGQILIDAMKMTPAHVLVVFVTLGAVLTAIGIYEPIVKIGGAGATVPITGFGYTLAKGAIKATKESGILGAFTGGAKAGAGGVSAAVVFGYMMAVIFNPKTKK
ncbi:stage V sporulation protein AE [Inediibacterium massiliense]|uniref:stage V sporulation protein AE n=1 Tax=Inediibacterium massiliense TaxID=1658111 RepID=UPI0006B3FBBB|nr:stage V sporulation protein AE [Inediibacterium massiliense]